ncbi:Uncharacterised protein [Nocardia otitidiscaviarum]|uniref:Uncharacterized protein n=1 Tax=Nocardia otitidiscaviarum TaxID=1823 RepID=A0A379JLL4_9NOCA|nr:hypothetical protein [Nocardia otitidiscaviarum]SUD49549.1 Uncharacterised protein [Nocardia otitidiscaviarum]
MSPRPDRIPAGGHPADTIPERPPRATHAQEEAAPQLTAVREPQVSAPEPDYEESDEAEVFDGEGAAATVPQEPAKRSRKATPAKAVKAAAAPRQTTAVLDAKQKLKLLSNDAYSAAQATKRANERVEALADTAVEMRKAGLSAYQIMGEIEKAAEHAGVDLPMADFLALLKL